MRLTKTFTLALVGASTLTAFALPAKAMYMQGYGCPEMTVNQVGEENGFAIYEFGGGCTPEVAKAWPADLVEEAKKATKEEKLRVCSEVDGKISKGRCIAKIADVKKRK